MDRGTWQAIESRGSQRVRHYWAHTHTHTHMHTQKRFTAGCQEKSPGQLVLKRLTLPEGFQEKMRERQRGRWVVGCVLSSWTFFWLVNGEAMEVNIINLLVPTGLESMCLWAAYSNLLPPGEGFTIRRTVQRIWLRTLSIPLKEVLDIV